MNKLTHFGLMLLLLTAFFATGCSSQEQSASAIPYKESFLVDVRTPAEFQAGSVPGAVNIPLDEVAERIGEFDGKKQVVVFCQSGGRSAQASQILKQNNIPNVVNGGPWTAVDAALKSENSAK